MLNFSPQNSHDLRIRFPFDQSFRFLDASYFDLHAWLQYRFCRTTSLALHTTQSLMGILARCLSILTARLCFLAHFFEQNFDLLPVRGVLQIMQFFMTVSMVDIVDIVDVMDIVDMGSSVPVVENAYFERAKIQAIVF